MRSAHSSK
jgi:hypothetical protein